MYHKGVCINNGAVPALESLFNSNQEKLRNKVCLNYVYFILMTHTYACFCLYGKAIEAVGKIASHDGKAREYVINGGIMLRLLALIQPNTSVVTLRYLTYVVCKNRNPETVIFIQNRWTLSIILGNTHSTKSANLDSNLVCYPYAEYMT